MELFTTLAILSFFSFIYGLGWFREDFVLELIGSMGLLILGIIWFSTGIQISLISDAGVFYQKDVPTAGQGGYLIAIIAVVLLLYCGSTIVKFKGKE